MSPFTPTRIYRRPDSPTAVIRIDDDDHDAHLDRELPRGIEERQALDAEAARDATSDERWTS